MKMKHQLSIATLVMAGVFATGCSQQTAGGSQVAGGSQSQIEGGSQVAGGSQQASSQQQVEAPAPVVAAPAPTPRPAPVVTAPAPAPVVVHRPRTNRWTHTHPAIPYCTKSIRHTHKYNQARHTHKYGCKKPSYRRAAAPRRVAPQQPKVDVYALQRKLKAKGYYKGPIDGVVGPGTRSALKRFMNR